MDRYTARMNAVGESARERYVNRLRNEINNKAPSNPSYKEVRLNGNKTNLIIDSGTKPYYKQFKSLPGQKINIGDYVEWANSRWLVIDCDYDNELYIDGTLNQCNYLLKWQNESGEIIERWAVVSSARYNDGTEETRNIVIGSDQLSVVVPVDAESIKLKKSMSKKFFIDNNTANPTTYELTGTGNVADTYNGHGVTSWIVKECAYTPTEDDLRYGVCNYFSPTIPQTPSDETTDSYYMKISCPSKNIKANGKSIVLIAQLYDGNDEKILNDIQYVWTITSNASEYIAYSQNENVLSVSVSNDCEDFGEQIEILCVSRYTGQAATETLTIQEAF